jgi:hypothetical protein
LEKSVSGNKVWNLAVFLRFSSKGEQQSHRLHQISEAESISHKGKVTARVLSALAGQAQDRADTYTRPKTKETEHRVWVYRHLSTETLVT